MSRHCDDRKQASHNGELAHTVEAGAISQNEVTQLGNVLARTAPGRSDDDVTIFDSTGLAIQDLAVALAAYRTYEAGELTDAQTIEL